MKKRDKRVETHQRSIFSLQHLLQAVVDEPSTFIKNNELYQALKSQGHLSKYVDEERSIVAMSLNTTKRIAESSLDQGFAVIDRLRMAAREALDGYAQKAKKSPKTTRVSLVERISELEMESQILKEELLLISAALEQSMQQARFYAERSGIQALVQLSQKEQCELRKKWHLKNNIIMLKGEAQKDG